MKKLKILIAVLLGTLAASFERLFRPRSAVALSNTLALTNVNGIESLIIDPTVSLPVTSKFLIYERGATGAKYAEIAGGTNVPLGPSEDSATTAGEIIQIRRLGVNPGLQRAIPATAITIDHLIYVDTGGTGKVKDLALAGNGTYWVIGRATMTVAATDLEVAFAPDVPYQITVSNGGGTYAFAGAGV